MLASFRVAYQVRLSSYELFSKETMKPTQLMFCVSYHVVRLTSSRRKTLVSNLQIIHDDAGQPMFAVLPWREYVRLAKEEAAEAILSDEEIYDLATRDESESFPIEVVDRLLSGISPIKVYREHRGMSQKELAAATNISPVYLSQIETGRRVGSAKTLASIAQALEVNLGDLV